MKPEWGKKVVCSECNSMFYDMNKIDIVCIKCGFKLKSATTKKNVDTKKRSKKSTNSDNKDFDAIDHFGSEDDASSVMNGNFVMEED